MVTIPRRNILRRTRTGVTAAWRVAAPARLRMKRVSAAMTVWTVLSVLVNFALASASGEASLVLTGTLLTLVVICGVYCGVASGQVDRALGEHRALLPFWSIRLIRRAQESAAGQRLAGLVVTCCIAWSTADSLVRATERFPALISPEVAAFATTNGGGIALLVGLFGVFMWKAKSRGLLSLIILGPRGWRR